MDPPQQPTELDFSKYRTEDLVGQLIEIISVPGAIRKVFKTIGYAIVLTAIACALLRAYYELTLLPWLVATAYCMVAAVLLGGLLGILRVIRAGLENVQGILGCTLDITRMAADDYQKLGAAEARLPSGKALLVLVQHKVVEPSLEKALKSAFGKLSIPLMWAYRSSLGRAISAINRRLSKPMDAQDKEQQASRSTLDALKGLNHYSERIESFAIDASKVINSLGQRLRFYAMFPLWVLYAVLLLVITLPLSVLLYLGAE